MADTPELPAVFAPGEVAVVTGAASGIGWAAARRFFEIGMKVALADRAQDALTQAAAALVARAPERAADVLAVPTDVAHREQVLALRAAVESRFERVSVLMNNAGVGSNPGQPWEHGDAWKSVVAVNLWGIVHGVEAFVPGMLAAETPALIINTGSKQGITSPPGNAAYNLSKAAVKSYTESLAYALRECAGERVRAHLLIPGFVFTGMTRSGSAAQKPAAAWTAEQVVEFMLARLAAGDFYILCPDNEVDRATDERRIGWAAGDIIENRPALSRWHPQFKEAFERHMAGS
ncbi:MAG TPA: SDR family NAD(P)-dependent oxidoreductase [Steroidobacteraceae bacterium]|jgi:NAD(P)-dependent dehydrogenase (short-subunit alcohol dehydrogenase family)|nr:SDR family NAD(P)-dependent oxidoreductase [Steroidobacteraceae bacterium]